MKKTIVAIVGAGYVGVATAYALITRGVASEILLTDSDTARCKGERLDLSDALPFSASGSVRMVSLKDAAQADIIIIAAGIRQKEDQQRLELLNANSSIIREIFQNMTPMRQESLIIMVTNPVDAMTLLAQEISGLPRNQIFGTGTFLDTQRLRVALGKYFKVGAESIHAYILGEHGPTQFPLWSSASVGGVPIDRIQDITQEQCVAIARDVRQKADEIIYLKKATCFGIAACVAELCSYIQHDQKQVIPLSWYNQEYDVCISMPVVLGSQGIERIFSMSMNGHEETLMRESLEALKAQKL